MESKKGKFQDFVILRGIAIVGVVFYHSFSVLYSLSADNKLYNFFFKDVFMFLSLNMAMLPLFVFISGYLFSYTQKKNYKNFSQIVSNKSKRLLFPYFFFGLLFTIFSFDGSILNVFSVVKTLIRGADHLWFLVMLFGCFVTLSLVQTKIYLISVPIILYLFYFCLIGGKYEYLTKVFTYERFIIFFPWFCIGFYSNKYDTFFKQLFTFERILILFLLYLTINITAWCNGYIWFGIIDNFFSYITQFLFILLIWGVAYIVSSKNEANSTKIFNKLDSLSFGIYIFHMYLINLILRYFSRNLNFIDIGRQTGIYFSIFLFLFSFVTSFYITKLVKRTRLGQTLLG